MTNPVESRGHAAEQPRALSAVFTRHGLFADKNWTGLPDGFPFASVVSLGPLIGHWRTLSETDPATYGETWSRLERALADAPELTEPIGDVGLLERHADLVEDLVRPLFPASDWTSDARALSGPFGGHVLYRTHQYEQAMGPYLEERMDIINVHDHYLRTLYAYKAILGRFYGIVLNLDQPLIFVIPQEESGLSRYFKLNASIRFATIERCGDLPELTPADVDALLRNVDDMARWQALLPPRLFRFSGLTVTRLTDVTHETAVAAITHLVLTSGTEAAGSTIGALEREVRTLFRDASLRMGVASLQAGGALDLSAERRLWNSLVLRDGVRSGELAGTEGVYGRALRDGEAIAVRDVAEGGEVEEPLRSYLLRQGVGSLLLQPLHYENRRVGLLELAFPKPRAVDAATNLKARRIEPIFALAVHVAESTAELKRSLTNLKATQAQLVQQEKMASLGALTAGIAHEIKNPLNFVTNFASLCTELVDELRTALGGGDADEVAALLGDLQVAATKIHEHGLRADGIVRAMMQHARGGSATREVVDLNTVVAEYAALAFHGKRAQSPDFDVAIEYDLHPDVGVVEVVPQEIGRVVLNLVGNALDAAREPGARSDDQEPLVRVTTRRMENRVEIRVEDNGPGVSGDVREKIFEPFFTTKPTGQGTGLGLSLSYDIVAQGHGGTLEVCCDTGSGAVFVATLPAPLPAPGERG